MNKLNKIIPFLATFLTIGIMTGCSRVQEPESDTVTVTDMEGNEVTVSKNISKVACISQSATDLMIAFGLGDKIVGTYRSFTYNTWTSVLYPNAANYKAYSYSVAAEELVNDGIELVIIQDTENADSFRNAGIPVVAVHQYSPTGAFDDEVYDTAKILRHYSLKQKRKRMLGLKMSKILLPILKLKLEIPIQKKLFTM